MEILNMSNLIVVAGYMSPGGEGLSEVLTLDGMKFEIKNEEIAKQFPLDTTKNGAVRIFIKPDAEILISAKASSLHLFNNPSRGPLFRTLATLDQQKENDPFFDVPQPRKGFNDI
jgi:hypothetical protein